MMRRWVTRQRAEAEGRIVSFYKNHYLPHVVVLPNARFGLYAVAREMFSTGDRVLLSAISCRTVVHALVAAGISPVFADIEMDSGNLDVRKLTTSTLRGIKGIITTNLYGNPDRAVDIRKTAERHGIPLIEDCAHVLRSAIGGREVGAIGDASVFSFKKYFDEPGGVITVRDAALAGRLAQRVSLEARQPAPRDDFFRVVQHRLSAAGVSGISTSLAAVHRRLPGSRHSASPDAATQEGATPQKSGRTTSLPSTATLIRVAKYLSRRDALVAEREAGAEELARRSGLSRRRAPDAEAACPMVVPFFSAHRDEVVARLRQQNIPTYYLYSPPLNRLFPEFATPGLNRDLIDEWCARILPIDVRHSAAYLDVLAELGDRYPAARPVETGTTSAIR
jgi:dTDP-4-amino-4,6-dideoxygalactose transaminase